MNTDLKPCPFCGAGAELRAGKHGHDKSWAFVRCASCPTAIEVESTNLKLVDLIENVVKAWNRRSDPRVFHEEYAVKMFDHVWRGDSEEDFELLKTLDGARKIVDRLESDDLMQGFWEHPKRTIVRRVVSEWEDA